MGIRWIFAALTLAAVPAWAANYAACILDKMPGTQSGPAFIAGMQLCSQKHTDQFFTIKRGSGRGIFAFKSAAACTADRAKATSWQPAAHQISRACECLFGESRGDLDMCQRYDLPQEIRQQHSTIRTLAETIALENHYRRIYAAHPDADEIFNRKDFQAWWVNDAARAALLTNGSTSQIIKLMREFKDQLASRGGPWGEGDRLAPPPLR